MNPPREEDLLAIAHILRPFGIRGEVNAVALAPPVFEPAELVIGRRLYLRKADTVREIVGEGLRVHKGRWLLTLQGIETMNDAETLRGYDLCLPRNELPALPEGWYWESDLQRCRVVDERLGELGQVAALDVNSPQPQLKITRPDGTLVSIPWLRAYVKTVDLDGALIQTALPVGFPGLDDQDGDA